MGKKQENIEKIITAIESAAQMYKENLVGRRFLYVFEGRHIEVIYKTQNFRHLTGVETTLPAKRFYRNAVNHRLQTEQIFFSKNHPYSLCTKKIKHIGEVAILAGSESFMLEEIKTDTQSYKFGTTDLNFTLCMNKEFDEHGNEKGDCYVVQSLRDEDCFKKSQEAYVVTHIFSRTNDGKKYTDLLYMDKSADMQNLPDAILALIDKELLEKTQLENALDFSDEEKSGYEQWKSDSKMCKELNDYLEQRTNESHKQIALIQLKKGWLKDADAVMESFGVSRTVAEQWIAESKQPEHS